MALDMYGNLVQMAFDMMFTKRATWTAKRDIITQLANWYDGFRQEAYTDGNMVQMTIDIITQSAARYRQLLLL